MIVQEEHDFEKGVQCAPGHRSAKKALDRVKLALKTTVYTNFALDGLVAFWFHLRQSRRERETEIQTDRAREQEQAQIQEGMYV